MYVPTVYPSSQPTNAISLENVENRVFRFIYSDTIVKQFVADPTTKKYVFYDLSDFHIHVDLGGQDCVKVSERLPEAAVEFDIYSKLQRTRGEEHHLARMIRTTSPVIDDKQYIFIKRYLGTLKMIGTLNHQRANTVMGQLEKATNHLLKLGVVHRDIKGDNVLVEQESPLKIRLSDFGLCFTRETFDGEKTLAKAIRRMYRAGSPKYKVPDAGDDVEWEPTGDPFLWVAQHRNYHEIMVTLMVARTNDRSRFPMGLKPGMSHYDYQEPLKHVDGRETWCIHAFRKMREAVLHLGVRKKRAPKRELGSDDSLHENTLLDLLKE